MKRFLKWLAIGLVTLVLVGVAGLYAMSQARLARPTPDALAALASDGEVAVSQERWLVFRPAGTRPDTGVIFYPGANCDVRGYAPVLRRIAAAGYLVVDLPMPFDFAIFAPDRAAAVPSAYPEIRRWVIIGHSMGGAMAGRYAQRNPDKLAGVVLWDSYPPAGNSLADSSLPVWHIHRALPDGTPAEKFTRNRSLFPPDSVWVPIPGGIHMYYGSFDGGAYVEEWQPTISRAQQQDLAVDATLRALRAMSGA